LKLASTQAIDVDLFKLDVGNLQVNLWFVLKTLNLPQPLEEGASRVFLLLGQRQRRTIHQLGRCELQVFVGH
jgi:hypothetical protein